MGNASRLVAIDLIEDTDVKHPVVDDQEKHRPFYKRPVETLDAFLHERGFIVEILQREEVACRDEE